MNFELKLLLWVTRSLPRVTGLGLVRFGSMLRRIYLREKRDLVIVNVLGFKMKLDPNEFIDQELLFLPQFFDYEEFDFMTSYVRRGDIFLDVGANIGIYSLVASRAVGETGRVFAFEADPYNYTQLVDNLALNSIDNVTALNVGVSNKQETLSLGLNTTGNRGRNSFLRTEGECVEVACFSLLDLLTINNIERVSVAKFDIEGFEFRVLSDFLAKANHKLYPKLIIIEHNLQLLDKAEGDAIELLLSYGYRTHLVSGVNYIMAL